MNTSSAARTDTAPSPFADDVRRACLPEVLLIPDLAAVLGVGESAARKAVLRGGCGPFVRLGRRIAVRRESFLAHLAEVETRPYVNPALKLRRDAEFVERLTGRPPEGAAR
jgi:hypothetical protein